LATCARTSGQRDHDFILVFELIRLEVARLLVDDVFGETKHVLGDFDVLNIVERRWSNWSRQGRKE